MVIMTLMTIAARTSAAVGEHDMIVNAKLWAYAVTKTEYP